MLFDIFVDKKALAFDWKAPAAINAVVKMQAAHA